MTQILQICNGCQDVVLMGMNRIVQADFQQPHIEEDVPPPNIKWDYKMDLGMMGIMISPMKARSTYVDKYAKWLA